MDDLEEAWPEIDRIACELCKTACIEAGNDMRIASMAVSLAMAMFMALATSTRASLDEGLKLNSKFVEAQARGLFKSMRH